MNPYQERADRLKAGETISFRPVGNSMVPRIRSNQLVTISPDMTSLAVGDIVLCSLRGRFMVHLVTALTKTRAQISNNHGKVNGWTGREHVYGRVIKVED